MEHGESGLIDNQVMSISSVSSDWVETGYDFRLTRLFLISVVPEKVGEVCRRRCVIKHR
jgi:hypothetical protein